MEILRRYREQIAYLFFGGCTTVVNFVVYFAMRAVGIDYPISNAVAIFLSILFAYVTNRIWVFQSKTKGFSSICGEFLKFLSARGVSALVDMGCMVVLLEWVKTGEATAKVVTAVFVVVLNYIFSKLFIFKKEAD